MNATKPPRNTRVTSPTYYHGFDVGLGPMLAESDEKGLIRLALGEGDLLDAVQLHLHGTKPPPASSPSDAPAASAAFTSLVKAVRAYAQGKAPLPSRKEAPLGNLRGTDFQKKVWRALQDIPFGEVRSYGDIAKAIGQPKAARAVGGACGKNPIPVLVPCHRVIASDGTLGGYTGDMEMKRRLLRLEGVTVSSDDKIIVAKRKT